MQPIRLAGVRYYRIGGSAPPLSPPGLQVWDIGRLSGVRSYFIGAASSTPGGAAIKLHRLGVSFVKHRFIGPSIAPLVPALPIGGGWFSTLKDGDIKQQRFDHRRDESDLLDILHFVISALNKLQ